MRGLSFFDLHKGQFFPYPSTKLIWEIEIFLVLLTVQPYCIPLQPLECGCLMYSPPLPHQTEIIYSARY